MEGQRKQISMTSGETLLSALQREKTAFFSYGNCGGRGSCGRCRVRFLKGAPLPSHADRIHFSPQELREGMRLACTANVRENCEVELLFADKEDAEEKMNVVTAAPHNLIKRESGSRKIGAAGKRSGYFLAIDIGTTTVAIQQVDCISGEITGTETFLNPGRMYGADVVSRIRAAQDGKLESMTSALIERIKAAKQSLMEAMKQSASGGAEPAFIICAGNTAMCHILAGEAMDGLCAAPFEPGDISLREIQIDGCRTIVFPGVSAFVGADIVAGVYACGMHESERLSLYLDLGTNGEMVLGNRERMLAAATAAGPAFEGNATAGVYGADMTAVIASLLKKGILDRTGLLAEPYFSSGVEEDGVWLTQQNIREFQLAKAAVRCGIEELLTKCGKSAGEVEQVYLAGGFGYYLSEKDALETGILPSEFAGKVTAVGNAALAGAVRYGIARGREGLPQNIEAMNLAEQDDFGEKYLGYLSF